MATVHLATAFNIAIGCSAILGNGLVIFVMTVGREQFSSFTNRLIRHQSIIDFVSGLVFLLITGIKQSSLVVNLERNFFGVFLCKLFVSYLFVWGVSVASTYNLVVISLERFLVTCHPVKHRNYCSLFKIKVSMCAAWIIGLIYSLRFFFVYTINGSKCGFDPSISPAALKIVVCQDGANQQDGVFSKAKRNVIATMLISDCMFFICGTPMQAFRLLYTTGVLTSSTPSLDFLNQTCKTLVMCNMSVNPVVYCFKYEHFRTQLKQLVRSRFGRNRVRPGEESTDAPSLSINPTQQNETRPL
ncbi:galanin receptor 2b-like [Asterias amurensis]|uniref:galanin receptor 2b-like n=1 Tax=Asterias amurensis TaxID=7602 RepID=UPI003AB50AC3